MLTNVKQQIRQRILALKKRQENKNTQILPFTNKDLAINCAEQQEEKSSSSSPENGDDAEKTWRIFPSWLKETETIDLTHQCQLLMEIRVNNNLHTTLATMWEQLQQRKAEFTADELCALKGLFERQLEATKGLKGSDLVVDMQISHGNAFIGKTTENVPITIITTKTALDFSDKFELIYTAPCLDDNITTLQSQLAVQHLDEQPIIAMPGHTCRQLYGLNVLIALAVLLQFPAYFWNLFSVVCNDAMDPKEEEENNEVMKWVGCVCLFWSCCSFWLQFGENNMRIYKLASAAPKEALHIQTRRLWLTIAILAALCAYPMLKHWLALSPLHNYILPQLTSVLSLSALVYAVLLAIVPCTAELCIQNCYLGKYQEQFERNKTVVQSERGLADSVRAILDRMGTPQCSAYKEAKMLQELFQYQPSG